MYVVSTQCRLSNYSEAKGKEMTVFGFYILLMCAIVGLMLGIPIALNAMTKAWAICGVVITAVSFLGLLMLGLSIAFSWVVLI